MADRDDFRGLREYFDSAKNDQYDYGYKLRSQFNSATTSDVVVKVGDEQIRAHKAVLSRYSMGLASRLVKDLSCAELVLHGEDSKAVKGMLASSYGLRHDANECLYDTGDLCGFQGCEDGMLDEVQPMQHLVALFKIAKKVGAQALADNARRSQLYG